MIFRGEYSILRNAAPFHSSTRYWFVISYICTAASELNIVMGMLSVGFVGTYTTSICYPNRPGLASTCMLDGPIDYPRMCGSRNEFAST